MSILEVIFAILVTTIGLLAALTVFPVAAAIAKKGAVADASSVHGRSAVHQFDAMGMRRPFITPFQPGGWMAWNPAADGGNGDFQQFPLIPFASYCIDPRFMAVNGTTATGVAASAFPYDAAVGGPRMVRLNLWSGLLNATGGVFVDANGDPFEMSKPQADANFMFNDDLTFDRSHKRPGFALANGDRSLPAAGLFTQVDSNNDNVPDLMTTRGSGGHLSWIATLVPKHELYAAPNVVGTDMFVLSVVVFNDRPLVNLSIDLPGTEMYDYTERVARASFADAGGTGFAGGELVLIWPADGSTRPATQANFEIAKKALHVRGGDWIMLGGTTYHFLPDALGNPVRVPIFRWYRVSEADHEPMYHTTEQHYEIAVSLTGQDWDTSLFATVPGTDPQATLVTGVVGVYEKTVRLETGTGF